MPRSKNWLTYPEAFHDLVREAAIRRVEVPCESEQKARQLRARVYAFFSSLEKEIKQPDADQAARDLRKMTYQVRLEVEGNIFVGYPRDEEPDVKLISDALRTQTNKPLVTDNLAPSAEMLKVLGEKKD